MGVDSIMSIKRYQRPLADAEEGLWGASKIYHPCILPLKKDNPESLVLVMPLSLPLCPGSALCHQAPPPSLKLSGRNGYFRGTCKGWEQSLSTPLPGAGTHTWEALPLPWGAQGLAHEDHSARLTAMWPHEAETAKQVGGGVLTPCEGARGGGSFRRKPWAGAGRMEHSAARDGKEGSIGTDSTAHKTDSLKVRHKMNIYCCQQYLSRRFSSYILWSLPPCIL